MAVPKRKTSKSKRNKRRKCGDARLPHHACPSCGTYKGRTVIETE